MAKVSSRRKANTAGKAMNAPSAAVSAEKSARSASAKSGRNECQLESRPPISNIKTKGIE